MSDVVNNDGAVGVAVVHGCQGLVSFLAGSIPNLEFDRGCVVKRNRLRKESGADGRFSVVIELVLED